MGIVDKIIFLLDKKGLNQKDLTDYLGVKKSVFSSWKSGKSVSFNKYINQIASFLGTTRLHLRGGRFFPRLTSPLSEKRR